MKAVKARSTAIALAGILALSACSGTTSAETAAVVDGRVITEQEVREATSQINRAFNPQQPLTAAQTLTLLIRAPYINEAAAAAGRAQSESAARAALKDFPETPADSTVEILQAEASLQQVDDAGRQELTKKFAEIDMKINPRYGRFDPQQASLVATSPNWLVPAAPAASAPAQPAQ
ncbi:hypothetical protein N798_11720 [Knoellia flava TL1]|uniref:Lipoprotein n=2 Tax=Knoellia flava TaxID=913969 RepID=A0A8H9FVN8_9MICO|nr:hypothetical protein [Knoellia flava]KGN30054.1 hypothetical protein N798_11720 [Knoellia flava TL1]GGB82464.1 hypothetical protein GCM10011314_22600 [Knoellia flava]